MRYPPLGVDDLILAAQKPSRYAGGEWNAIHKSLPDAAVTWALCFPDLYEVGMSNLGFRVLYHVLNQRPDVACERAFMPWEDMEARMRATRTPLWSIESRAPIAAFDVLGFTLQTELCYPTVLAMLDLAGIPLFSSERDASHPLVLGGGPCAYSPEPVAPFFDAFVVGEGEEVVHEISDAVADWKSQGGSRRELLWRLSEIRGVYVPAFFEYRYRADGRIDAIVPLKAGYEKVGRRVIPDLNLVPQPERPIVPFMQTVHDRLPLEIQRGCTRSCRFCQVGMLTRPTRQRDPHEVRRMAEIGLANTGYEQVGFLSLSAGDYQAINPMLEDFFARFEAEQIAVSLPSLRTETMNDALAAQIKRVRKTGFTMAPEAASERMRRVINKGNRESDLMRAAESVFQNGWDTVKLYFMVGLPTERDEDVQAIAEVAQKVLQIGRRVKGGAGTTINLGVSTFVPKPFTPFQWEPMIPMAETQRKHQILRNALTKTRREIDFRYHEPEMTSVEGALTRGDRRVSEAIFHAFKAGQALDGWTERFRHQVWMRSFEALERNTGVGLPFFGERERTQDEVLPWDHLDCEVTRPFLWKERMNARKEAEVIDCALDPCSACGACDYDVVTTRTYTAEDYQKAPALPERPPIPTARSFFRIRYAKRDRAVALSHLETTTAILRALRRSKLPLAFSQGFHPKPRVSFGPATPVGATSQSEYLDVELVGEVDLELVRSSLGPQMPGSLAMLEVDRSSKDALPLAQAIAAQCYRYSFPEAVDASELSVRWERFRQAEQVWVARKERVADGDSRPPSRGPQKRVDVRAVVQSITFVPGSRDVEIELRAGNTGSARPAEVLEAWFGADAVPPGVRITKHAVVFVAGSIPARAALTEDSEEAGGESNPPPAV